MAETNDGSREAEVRACLMASHANTRALLACLRACADAGEGRPYREIEAAVAPQIAQSPSMQTPHTLLGLLERAGAIERIEVPETPADGGPTALSEAPADSGDPAVPPVGCAGEGPTGEGDPAVSLVGPAGKSDPAAACDSGALVDASAREGSIQLDAAPEPASAPAPDAAPAPQPIDYLLRITEAGRRALAEFDPVARFTDLVSAEPEGYLDAYVAVLDVCADADGASLRQVEQALAGHPALATPKRIYPTYFVSKLETVEGIAWDGTWRITPAGERMLASLT